MGTNGLIEWTSIETCFGKNFKLGLKNVVNCLNFTVLVRGEVKDIWLEAKDTKKFYAKNRPSSGQGQTFLRPRTKDAGASVLQEKKIFKIIFQVVSKN